MKKLTEIARSFTYKLNTGNYTSRDFFCSQKLEVPEDEAEATSERLFNFCREEVMKSVKEYLKDNPIGEEKKKWVRPTMAEGIKSQKQQESAEQQGNDFLEEL